MIELIIVHFWLVLRLLLLCVFAAAAAAAAAGGGGGGGVTNKQAMKNDVASRGRIVPCLLLLLGHILIAFLCGRSNFILICVVELFISLDVSVHGILS